MGDNGLYHESLACGAELVGQYLPARRVVAINVTFLAGLATEPASQLGVAQLTEDLLDKGTERYTAGQLADAFDAIGARRNSTTGRETISFGCIALTEFFERVVELHAEMLARPTFPNDQVEIARGLSLQEFDALEDDPMDLLQKAARRQALGPILGRHPLGERETLEKLGRAEVVEYWRENLTGRRMQVVVVGPVEPRRAAAAVERYFCPLSKGAPASAEALRPELTAARTHYSKQVEQVYMALSWPGTARQASDWPAEAVVLNILSGGMSSRLFTEVREKQGLVYWVSAWPDYLRGAGMLSMGASTSPQRRGQTYETLLREVERLGQDLGEEELERAKRLIAARRQTRGELTRVRASELAEDLFYFGIARDRAEETRRIEQVSVEDIRRYLASHAPRPEQMSVVTLGPESLAGQKPE